MIVGMAMLFSFSLVDTLFISYLGTDALTAISFTFPVTFMVTSLAIGLGIGTSAVVAKYLGRSDPERARQASTVTNYVAVMLSVVLSLACLGLMDRIFLAMGASAQNLELIRQYMIIWLPGSSIMVAIMTGNSVLRACGDTRTASFIMAGGGFINAVLDPILIFGLGPIPALGMAGAAVATVIAWSLSCGYLFFILAFRLDLVSRVIPTRQIMLSSSREMLSIGIPAAGANMMTPLAAGVMTAIVASYGDAAVAAFGVGSRIEPIATLILLAMSSTLPPLISQNYGAGRLDRVSEAYAIAIRFILTWQLLVYGVLALGAGFIAGIFTDDAEVAGTIRLYLWILPLGYGLQGIIILTNSSLNALHRPLEALYLSAARFFIFYVPMAWLGSRLMGLNGFFIGALLGNCLMAALSVRVFRKVMSGEQSRQATPDPAETGA